jgi:hypothetical protein
VDGRGVARVPCPRCGHVRVWLPDGAPLADDGWGALEPGFLPGADRKWLP